MKYMIASDIHGSAYYCRKVLQALEEEGADRLILLGDLLYHGPRNDLPLEYAPKQVIPMLNGIKEKLLAVRGNCDDSNDLECINFPVCENYLVIKVDGKNWYLTHGHLNYKLPELGNDDILFNGHTHCYELSKDYINPGSLSLPIMHSEHTYIIYQNKSFKLYDLDGNVINELKI